MGGLARRAVLAAGAAVVLLGAATGAASATQEATLAFTPSPYDYGQVTHGHTAAQTFTLTNTGGKASGALTITVPGPAAFTITADTCPGSLGPRKTCSVTVQFSPAGAGTASATLTAVNNKGDVLATDPLAGTGAAPGHLYWVDLGSSDTIMRSNLDGTDVTALVSGLEGAGELALDSSHIYWGSGDAIMEANLDGTEVTALDGTGVTTIVTAPLPIFQIALDGSHMYWAQKGPVIDEANLDGSNATALLSGQQVIGQWFPVGVAVDSSHVYWTTVLDGWVREANLDGTGVTTLVTGQGAMAEIEVGP